jgi:hypothetical protein
MAFGIVSLHSWVPYKLLESLACARAPACVRVCVPGAGSTTAPPCPTQIRAHAARKPATHRLSPCAPFPSRATNKTATAMHLLTCTYAPSPAARGLSARAGARLAGLSRVEGTGVGRADPAHPHPVGCPRACHSPPGPQGGTPVHACVSLVVVAAAARRRSAGAHVLGGARHQLTTLRWLPPASRCSPVAPPSCVPRKPPGTCTLQQYRDACQSC